MPNSSLRILFLNTQMEAGGAQKAMLVLAQGIKQRGHTIIVVTMYDKESYVPLFSEQVGIPIIDLRMKPPGNSLVKARAFISGLKHLYDIMRQNDIDVLQTFTHYSNIAGPFIGWLARVPVRVSSQRGTLQGVPSVFRLLDRIVANSALVQKMTTVSEGMRYFCVEVQKINPDKVLVIPNSIEAEEYNLEVCPHQKKQFLQELGIDQYSWIVTTVARLHPVKGHEYLLKAIPQILERVPGVHFLFAGEGPLYDQIKKEVHELMIDDSVHLLAVRQDIPMILACSDLFVLPSLSEGMPNVALEAMAAGLPVVATAVGGIPEIVKDGENGLLVPPGDPHALAVAITRILTDPPQLKKMGSTARESIINKFPTHANISAYEELYQSLRS